MGVDTSEQDGRQNETLSRSRNVTFRCKIGEKRLDFLFAHSRGMTLAVKKNEAFNPKPHKTIRYVENSQDAESGPAHDPKTWVAVG